MRRSLCLVLLSFICASAFPAKCLMIELTDGKKIYYSFEKYVPIIRFEDGVMSVSTRKLEFSRIVQFAVIEEPAAVETVEAALRFSPDGTLLTFPSLDPIHIYNVQGVLQRVEVTTSDNAQYVDFSSLPKGAYVVRYGEQSFTIYKK